MKAPSRNPFPWRALLKGLVSATALTYVAWQLYADRASLQGVWEYFSQGGWGWAVVASLLVTANLGLEAEKWRVLVLPSYPALRRSTAIKAVLAGMAAGFFTPNRIGDYAGRILYLPEGHRIEAAVATFADRICQMGVTLLAGTIVLGLFLKGYITEETALFGAATDRILWATALVSFCVFLGFLFFPAQLARLLPRKRSRILTPIRRGLEELSPRRLRIVFFLAALRYSTFTTQYILFVHAFDPSLAWTTIAAGCILVFLAKSVLPLPGVLELGVRESIALTVFGALGAVAGGIVHATFAVYLINMVLPTLVGVVAWQGIRFADQQNREEQP